MRQSTDKGRFAIAAATVFAAATVVALPAHDASARGNGWQHLGFAPYDATCGATTVHVSAVSDEFYRDTTLPDGTVQSQVTGSLYVTYKTDAGKSVTVNSSGPGYLFVSPDGVVRVIAHGRNSFTFSAEQAASLGVPQISVSAGPFDVTWHTDGTVSGHLGNIIEDVCAELT